MRAYVEITICGHLSSHWSDQLDGMAITCLPDGTTRLSGTLPDQAALIGLLLRLHNFGLELKFIKKEKTHE